MEYSEYKEYKEYTQLDHQEVDEIIINERNNDLIQIQTDMSDMEEIYNELGKMISIQGENMDLVHSYINRGSRDVASSIKNLADSQDIIDQKYKMIRNISIVVGSITLGACGFIAGPLIGLGTVISSAGLGSGMIYVSNK